MSSYIYIYECEISAINIVDEIREVSLRWVGLEDDLSNNNSNKPEEHEFKFS
jgi:hypothetical protein